MSLCHPYQLAQPVPHVTEVVMISATLPDRATLAFGARSSPVVVELLCFPPFLLGRLIILVAHYFRIPLWSMAWFCGGLWLCSLSWTEIGFGPGGGHV